MFQIQFSEVNEKGPGHFHLWCMARSVTKQYLATYTPMLVLSIVLFCGLFHVNPLLRAYCFDDTCHLIRP